MAATSKPMRKSVKDLKLNIHHSPNSPSKKEAGKIMIAHAKSNAKNKDAVHKFEKKNAGSKEKRLSEQKMDKKNVSRGESAAHIFDSLSILRSYHFPFYFGS